MFHNKNNIFAVTDSLNPMSIGSLTSIEDGNQIKEGEIMRYPYGRAHTNYQ